MLYWLYYIACVIYATARSLKKWKNDDMGASSLDMLMILTIGWILSPIDFGIVWYKHYHSNK